MQSNPLPQNLRFALDAFILDGMARNLRPKTLAHYRQQLTWFLVYASESAGCVSLADIAPHTIKAYLVHLKNDLHWMPVSVHTAARSIRTFFGYCVRDELLKRSPMDRVKMPKTEQPTKPPFSNDEINRLISAAKTQRDRAMIYCLLDSGCRVSEFVAWNVGDINFATGAVHLQHTKNRKARTVYLGTLARRELLKYMRALPSTVAGAPIWIDEQNGKRLLPNGVSEALRRLGARAKVKPVGPHRFRHTFAISYLRNGGDIFTLQRLLGHSSLEMVKRYLALDAGDLEQAHRKFGVVDRLTQR